MRFVTDSIPANQFKYWGNVWAFFVIEMSIECSCCQRWCRTTCVFPRHRPFYKCSVFRACSLHGFSSPGRGSASIMVLTRELLMVMLVTIMVYLGVDHPHDPRFLFEWSPSEGNINLYCYFSHIVFFLFRLYRDFFPITNNK